MKPTVTSARQLSLYILFLMASIWPLPILADNITEIAALREVADSLHSIGRTDSAAIMGQQAIGLSEKSGNPTLIVGAHSSQGVYLRSLGRIDEALQSYEKALEIVTSGAFRKNPGPDAIEEIASLYINLAVLNLDMQQKDEAAKNAINSAGWISKSKDPELKSTIFGVVGSVLTGCGDLDKALKYQELAYNNAIESGNDEAAFRAAAYTMLNADKSGDKSTAAKWRKKCNELMPEIQSSMALLVYYQAECSICLKNNDDKGSVVWFNNILSLDGIDNLPFVKLDCYGNLHDAYARSGDYKSAYATLAKAYELRNELWKEEKSQSLQELTVKYDAKKKELALAQSEAKLANSLMWLFATVGLLLIGVVVFIIYAGRQKRRRMQQYIQGLENERRRMSTELHDGVCSDLFAVQMKMAQGEPVETIAGMIDTCREAVRRISHELMPPEFTYADINEVVKYFVAKQQDTYAKKIKFDYKSESIDAEWKDIPEETALEVYRIIQEAVSNSVKHSGAGHISVSLMLKGKELSAKVTDNGTYKFNDKKGIGEESMRHRAGVIGGSIEMKRDKTGGTEVILSARIQ